MKRQYSENNTPANVVYEENEEPIVLSKALIDTLLHQDNPMDLIGLYSFYYFTAKWQKTNQPWAEGKYVLKCLKIGRDRFEHAQKKLIELKLIEKLSIKENGKFKKWVIKVNFIWKTSNVPSTLKYIQLSENTQLEKPVVGKTTCGFQDTIALSSNSINALSSNKSSSCKTEKITPNDFETFWELYPKKTDKGKSLKIWTELCTQKSKDNIRPTLKQVLKAIQLQKDSERWQDKQFIPHPTTWLNQMRWLDDPKEMTVYKPKQKPNNHIGTRELTGHVAKYREPDHIFH